MPAIVIIAIAIWLFLPARTSKRSRPTRHRIASYSQPSALPAPVAYDPIKVAKEQDRQRREQERQADRSRREADRQRKEAERIAKQDEARRAAADRVEWCAAMIDKYGVLYEQIEQELENNPGLTEYKRIQLQKQLLTIEEKLHRYHEQRDKAYFTAYQNQEADK